jgi:DNA-directed RNA polymerase subunit RPC12/RpoP
MTNEPIVNRFECPKCGCTLWNFAGSIPINENEPHVRKAIYKCRHCKKRFFRDGTEVVIDEPIVDRPRREEEGGCYGFIKGLYDSSEEVPEPYCAHCNAKVTISFDDDRDDIYFVHCPNCGTSEVNGLAE